MRLPQPKRGRLRYGAKFPVCTMITVFGRLQSGCWPGNQANQEGSGSNGHGGVGAVAEPLRLAGGWAPAQWPGAAVLQPPGPRQTSKFCVDGTRASRVVRPMRRSPRILFAMGKAGESWAPSQNHGHTNTRRRQPKSLRRNRSGPFPQVTAMSETDS